MDTLKIERVKLDDITIAFHQNGDGSNLLLLHGNSGSKKYFKKYQLEYFSSYHTYALDSRGHGHSHSKESALSYKQQSMDVLKFCHSLGISNTSVIGYSDGGNLALWLALQAPDIFNKVVAISPNTLASGSTKLALWATQAALQILKALRFLGLKTHKQIMRFELMLTDTGITDEDLQNIKTKVLILYAEDDLVREGHLLEVAGQIPGCQVKKINNANHITIPFRAETIKAIQDYLL